MRHLWAPLILLFVAISSTAAALDGPTQTLFGKSGKAKYGSKSSKATAGKGGKSIGKGGKSANLTPAPQDASITVEPTPAPSTGSTPTVSIPVEPTPAPSMGSTPTVGIEFTGQPTKADNPDFVL